MSTEIGNNNSNNTKMGQNSALGRIIQAITAAALVGILVVLALLLIEVKKFTNEDQGLVASLSSDPLGIKIVSGYNGLGVSPSAPLYMSVTNRS
ncbi:unnamed protein product [Clonostachys solani]|uniref:Uncharacterized protein n=1 Tax=Clonostachys solani TaxID=160281 RepID=A0A9N9YV71_9HYPO|nr:unnamed protein product [Clonostachys solani]